MENNTKTVDYQNFTFEDFKLNKNQKNALVSGKDIEIKLKNKGLVTILTKRGYELVKVCKNFKKNVFYFENLEPVELKIKKIKYKKVRNVLDIYVKNNKCKSFKTSTRYIKKFNKNANEKIMKKIIEELPSDFGNISSIYIDNYPREEIIDDTPIGIVLEIPSVCIICTAQIQLEDNSWIKIEQLIIGQRIKLYDGKIGTIDVITKNSYNGKIYGCLTAYHPIEYNGKLEFVSNVLNPTGVYNDNVYNIGAICDDDSRGTKIIIKDFEYPVACAFSNEVSVGEPTYSKEWGTTESTLYDLVKKRGGFLNLDTWEFLRDDNGIAYKIVRIFL